MGGRSSSKRAKLARVEYLKERIQDALNSGNAKKAQKLREELASLEKQRV